ncbi:MAG: Na+/H+ antiporter NhaA [Flavobacteriales bacterium]
MIATKLFNEFFNSEKAGGIVLLVCTIISISLANTSFATTYIDFWNISFADHTIAQWINDGLMAIFFLLIGLELEREIYKGELSNIKDALLPIFGAIGGIVVPAGIYLALNWESPTQNGAGIPMATDIAFALAVIALLGKRVPVSVKVFLTALAVIDDLGAILIIAFFYTSTIFWSKLLISLAVFAVLLILNRLKVRNLIPYIIGGIVMWYFMLQSGVHATITGVLLAFAIPFGDGGENSTSYILQHFLHKPVAFVVLPIFALANTAIIVDSNVLGGFSEPFAWGIACGLLLGKPIGIFLFTFISSKAGWAQLPSDINWRKVLGVGFLGGIGFTMSIFITLLAFSENEIINTSKLVIFLCSLVAGAIGFMILRSEKIETT